MFESARAENLRYGKHFHQRDKESIPSTWESLRNIILFYASRYIVGERRRNFPFSLLLVYTYTPLTYASLYVNMYVYHTKRVLYK